jgi:tetratricopeptide (TPR) repeat protein
MLEGFLSSPLFVRMRFARWDEILKVPEPDKALRIAHSVWQFARGVALAKTGKVAEAEKTQAAFRDEIKALPGETPFGLNSAQSVLAVAENELAARIAWAKGDKAKSIESWQKAVAAQDALNYDEPPAWYHPARESLGAALLESGSAAQAEQIFRADLKQNPRNGRSLFGLKESLKAQGKTDSAMMVEREFEQAWKRADSPLKIADL